MVAVSRFSYHTKKGDVISAYGYFAPPLVDGVPPRPPPSPTSLCHQESEMETEEEVDILMSSDVYSATLSTKSITFSRSQIGWLFREDKTVSNAHARTACAVLCMKTNAVDAAGECVTHRSHNIT